jgi:hypothetical protein
VSITWVLNPRAHLTVTMTSLMMCSEASKASVLDASGPRSGFRTGVFHTFALIMIQIMMDPAPQLHSLNFSIIFWYGASLGGSKTRKLNILRVFRFRCPIL